MENSFMMNEMWAVVISIEIFILIKYYYWLGTEFSFNLLDFFLLKKKLCQYKVLLIFIN